MDFLREIQTLTENYDSPKLEEVKNKIRKVATNGENELILNDGSYDKWVLDWFRIQGFFVEVTADQRDGNFARIRWSVKQKRSSNLDFLKQ